MNEDFFRNFCNTNNFKNITNIKCYYNINGLFILLSNLIPRHRKFKNVILDHLQLRKLISNIINNNNNNDIDYDDVNVVHTIITTFTSLYKFIKINLINFTNKNVMTYKSNSEIKLNNVIVLEKNNNIFEFKFIEFVEEKTITRVVYYLQQLIFNIILKYFIFNLFVQNNHSSNENSAAVTNAEYIIKPKVIQYT